MEPPLYLTTGLSIKNVCSQEEGVVQFEQEVRGVLQMRTFVFWGAKTLDFSKFMVYPHGQGVLRQCGHFSVKEKGVNFSRFCATSFMDGPYCI